MTTALIITLVVEAAAFAVWAFLMFRTLFELRRRGAQHSGQTFPGPGETLAQWRQWLRAPEDARARRQLGLATLVLIGTIIAVATQTP